MVKLMINVKEWIRYELQDGEVVVWLSYSNPVPVSRTVRAIFLRLIRYSIVLAVVFYIFPLFFSTIIFVIATIRFSVTKRLSYSVYIITNRRAIILNDAWVRKFDSYYPHQLKKINVRESVNGSGNIILRSTFKRDNKGYLRLTELGFKRIANVNKVRDLISTLMKSSSEH